LRVEGSIEVHEGKAHRTYGLDIETLPLNFREPDQETV
jgi:hypothetical protein